MNPNGYLKETIKKHIDLLSGYPFKSEQYVEEGINICGGLIIMPQKIKWNECVHLGSIEGFEDYLLKDNDIVIALDRPWISEGFKIAKVDAEHLPALLIQRTARIRAIDINQDYLYYCFIEGGFDKYCNVTGSVVPHISAKDIENFEVMIPPVELQNQFADFVKQIDKSKVIFFFLNICILLICIAGTHFLCFFLLKWLQKDHPSKDQQIHYQCNRNISPVDLLILKYIRRVRS